MLRSESGHVWSLITVLFTQIAVCKLLRGLAVVWPETVLFFPLYVFINCPASFCTMLCALDFARDHAT